VLADSGIDDGAVVITRLAVLDFHRALGGARQQSDEVDSVRTVENNLKRLPKMNVVG
jgi:hypothetical protein